MSVIRLVANLFETGYGVPLCQQIGTSTGQARFSVSREWTYTLYAAASREMPQHWFQETKGYGVFVTNRGFRDTHKINMIVGW